MDFVPNLIQSILDLLYVDDGGENVGDLKLPIIHLPLQLHSTLQTTDLPIHKPECAIKHNMTYLQPTVQYLISHLRELAASLFAVYIFFFLFFSLNSKN